MNVLVLNCGSSSVRFQIIEYLTHKEGLGLREIDSLLNQQSGMLGISGITGDITRAGSGLKAYVIPSNEELLIARDTYRVVTDSPRRW